MFTHFLGLRRSGYETNNNQSAFRASSFMLWTNCIVKLNAGTLNQRGKKALLETGGVSWLRGCASAAHNEAP